MAIGETRKLVAFAAVFTVADVGASLAFYVDRLGFLVHFQMGDPIDYAIVERDAVSIHLMPPRQHDAASVGRSNIYVFTADVDALHDELRSNGCAIEVPPTVFSYGMREMSVRDPGGNRITFGQEVKRSAAASSTA